ncbi:MAG: PEP-CTERM sorting domain-containing protein [Opitutaceae bacterium]|jgi:hypothetical protein
MKASHRALAAFFSISLGLTGAQAALVGIDNFSSVSDGTLLSAVSGWSTSSTTATVSSGFGFGGSKGVEIVTAAQSNALILTGSNIMTSASGLVQFNADIRIGTTDSYNIPQILIGKNDGVNGFAIRFNGGTANGASDNFVQISSGTGTSWGSPGVATVANSAWVPGDWYEVRLTVSLPGTGTGQTVTGTLSIYNLSTSSYLLQNTSIAGLGSSGSFDTINVISLQGAGSNRTFDVSNLQIGTAIPEPSTAAILSGASILGFAVLRRRSHQNVR